MPLINKFRDEKKDKKEDEKPKQEKPKEGDADNIEGEKVASILIIQLTVELTNNRKKILIIRTLLKE